MDSQDLRTLLEQTDNKLSIFANAETLNKYNLTVKDLFDLVNDFLSDEEKLKLFDYPHFRKFNNNIKCGIVSLISNEHIILQIINDDNIVNDFETYQIVDIVEKMNDTGKQQFLYNQDFIKKHQLSNYDINTIISSLTDEAKSKLLMDVDLIKNKLQLNDFQVTELIKNLSIDQVKDKAIELYQIESYQKISILNTCSDAHKLNTLLKSNDLKKFEIIDILKTLDIENLNNFLAKHKTFFIENNILPYEITRNLSAEQQKEFIANLENANLTLNEKREILATLKTDVKQSIDTTNFPEEYKTALSIQTEEYIGKIILDFKRNLEDYRGLDNLISITPEELTEEEKVKLIKLCDICPNSDIINTLNNNSTPCHSNAKEYKEAEEWISSLLSSLNSEYSKAQKLAIIDNAIGKKISYTPDFDTEVFNPSDARALWKIISSGYGVCNGISNLEHYILNKVGIESEFVETRSHTFLKVKDIELPLANGEVVKGNTILDPTWNLTQHRFNGKPNNFCINYEQARKSDIDIEGKDHNCHKNDEQLQDATVGLDEQSLRKLFLSVGLTNEDGKFPITSLLEKSKQIDTFYESQPEENINKQFELLQQVCPEFATCQNSSITIIRDVLFANKNLNFNKCVINRVYNREDKEKRPVLFVYIDSNELGRKFYFADKDTEQFLVLSQEEFTKQFECYELDLKKHNGLRLWEDEEPKKENIDLSKSSGKIVAEER